MLDKIPLDSILWKQVQGDGTDAAPSTQELLARFLRHPEMEGETFYELHDRIFDSNTCLPAFYLVLPYLIEEACGAPFDEASELWAWISSWLAEGVQSRGNIPQRVMEVYESWLDAGVKGCLRLIAHGGLSGAGDLPRLLGAPLGMVNPAFGYVSSSVVKEDIGFDSELETRCPNGHLCCCILRDAEICNSRRQKGLKVTPAVMEKMVEEMPVTSENPWRALLKRLEFPAAEDEIYFRAARQICEKGVSKNTPVLLTLVLYGCLLTSLSQDAKDRTFARRCFYLTDRILCPECGASFSFAEGWIDDSWFYAG